MAGSSAIDPIERAKAGDAGARLRDAGPDTRERNLPFDVMGAALRYGLMAGVVLGVIQVAVLAGSGRVNIGGGLLGMFAIAPFLWIALRAYRRSLAAGEVAKNGLILGFYTSAIASGVMAAITLVAGLAGVAANDHEAVFGNIAVYSFFQILLGIVIGMVITFILLQGLKEDAPADANIEKVEGHA